MAKQKWRQWGAFPLPPSIFARTSLCLSFSPCPGCLPVPGVAGLCTHTSSGSPATLFVAYSHGYLTSDRLGSKYSPVCCWYKQRSHPSQKAQSLGFDFHQCYFPATQQFLPCRSLSVSPPSYTPQAWDAKRAFLRREAESGRLIEDPLGLFNPLPV